MANVAVERLLRNRIDLMFGVIEICLRHPAINEDWFGNCRCAVSDRFHFMTKSAAGKIPARSRAHVLLWFVGIFGEENRVLELVAGMKLIAQLLDLLPDKRRDLALGN